MTAFRQPAFLPEEENGLVAYLTGLYQGVFSVEAIRAHLDNHVGDGFADYALAVTLPHLPKGARILDLGSGFGGYVVRAREAGFDAIGIERAPFEVAFSRARLARVRPDDRPERVFREGDANQIGQEAGPFDAVTLWNVLEHVEDATSLLANVDRLLRPGGQTFIVCPNYQATRDEAHYHVPWNAGLSRDRDKAIAYLRSQGRDPRYFETSIFCRSNREIIAILEGLGYDLFELSARRPMSFRWRHAGALLRHFPAVLRARGAKRHSVEIVAVKPDGARS